MIEDDMTPKQITLEQKKESLLFYESEVTRNQTMVDLLKAEIYTIEQEGVDV